MHSDFFGMYGGGLHSTCWNGLHVEHLPHAITAQRWPPVRVQELARSEGPLSTVGVLEGARSQGGEPRAHDQALRRVLAEVGNAAPAEPCGDLLLAQILVLLEVLALGRGEEVLEGQRRVELAVGLELPGSHEVVLHLEDVRRGVPKEDVALRDNGATGKLFKGALDVGGICWPDPRPGRGAPRECHHAAPEQRPPEVLADEIPKLPSFKPCRIQF